MNSLCGECGGQCCRLIAMNEKLLCSPDELDMLRARGYTVENERDIGLLQTCQHFAGGVCLRYADRPAYCADMEVNGETCRRVRALMLGRD